MSVYFVLRCSEDGDITLEAMTEKALLVKLAVGEIDGHDAVTPNFPIYDFASGEAPLVIIKGEVVIPKAAEKVKAWEV